MAKTKKISTSNKRAVSKAKLLYLFLIPMFISTIITLFHSDYNMFAKKIVAFIIFFAGIKLVDSGLEFDKIYKESKIIKIPFIKHKLLGYFLISLDLGFMDLEIANSGFFNAIVTSVIAFIGLGLYYGIDPMKSKLPKGSSVNVDRFLKELQEAEEKVNYIKNSTNKIDNWELENALKGATHRAEEILKTIKEDPKDIRVARKFMVVYLDGIKDVIDSYNGVDKKHLDSSFTHRLIETLDLASKRFEKELERLKSNEIFDLDVQIDALKEQLKH